MSAQPATTLKGSGIRIYNTLTRTKEPFETINPGEVRMYVCGVTVYDDAHIGHGMSSIVFDVIRRYLIHRGYTVRYAQNFTDVDDKIIARANAEELNPNELVERLIADWNREVGALGILPATVTPRATQEIPQIIAMIEGLIERGHAYESLGDVYFRVRSFPDYGKLSGRDVDDMRSGARIDVSEQKEDPLDFALWKAAKPGEPMWDSPWSKGRPGWHIECSAMCSHHLDGMVDIHGGGRDLIFPHHENEIAQSEAFFGREPFARYWVHNGMLRLGNEKMSKSLGNVVKLSTITESGRAAAFRLLVLQSHYRAPLTYSPENLEAAESGLSRLRVAARPGDASTAPEAQGTDSELEALVDDVDARFHTAMDDDFDTASALAALFDLGRAINRARSEGGNHASVERARKKLVELADVFGLDLEEPEARSATDAAPFIDLLIDIRRELRDARQFQLADRIRDQLSAQGVLLEDTATGTTWKITETSS